MFSDAVIDHFRNPRNAGELPGADASVEVSNPVCGDILHLAAAEALSLTAQSLADALGGLPPATLHGAELAADAMQALLRKISAKRP